MCIGIVLLGIVPVEIIVSGNCLAWVANCFISEFSDTSLVGYITFIDEVLDTLVV